MKNNIEIEKTYYKAKEHLNDFISDDIRLEEDLLKIINILKLNSKFEILQENNYNYNEISNLFRFYEDELKSSFSKEKVLFQKIFQCYILLIEVYTELCILFSTNKIRKQHIDTILQLLKETKNMLKFFIPLEEKYINIINDMIGQQLYYLSHIQYISIKDKDLDYIFDEYHMNLEKQLHGFELSLSTNFANNKVTNRNIEYAIFMNNSSFLLLKMIHKLRYYKPDINIFENNKFKNILILFCEISLLHKNLIPKNIKEFEYALIKEFSYCANYLREHKNHDMYEEKTKLLHLNTDEYKQLIDIILLSKEQLN